MSKAPCTTPECDQRAESRGLCRRHYMRWYQANGLAHRTSHLPMPQRFWVKVDKDGPVPEYRPDLGPCWIWTAAKDKNGYGRFGIDGRTHVSHRVAYELSLGPIPAKMTIDHLCRVHSCVNPGHMEPVSLWENTLRGESPIAFGAKKAQCANGHPYDETNTVYRTKQNGRQYRRCRTCLDEQKGSARQATMKATRHLALQTLVARHEEEFEALLRDLRSGELTDPAEE